jgi:polygalacturonase
MASVILEGYFNVRDFGAGGDGSTNDSPAIERAIDAAGGEDGRGGVVWFPPGTYLIGPGTRSGRGIHVPSPVILAGAGAGTPFGTH